jgi:hypothetical protein
MINTKLQNIIDTKSAIGNAIVNKGGTITSETPFYNYAEQIDGISTGTPQIIFQASDGSKWALTNAVNLVNDAGNVTHAFNWWQPANNSTSTPILNSGTVTGNISTIGGGIRIVRVNQVNITQYLGFVAQDDNGAKYEAFNGYDFYTNPTPTGNTTFNRWLLNNSATGTVVFANATFTTGTYNGSNTTVNESLMNLTANSPSYGVTILTMAINNGFVYVGGSSVVRKYHESNLALVGSLPSYGGNVTSIAINNGFIFTGGRTTPTTDVELKVYYESNLALYDETDHESSTNIATSSMLIDNGIIYTARGNFIRKAHESNLANISNVPNYASLIETIAINNGFIYAGGSPRTGVNRGVIKFNPSTAAVVGSTPNYGGQILSITTNNGFIYVGGATNQTVQKFYEDNLAFVGNTISYGGNISTIAINNGFIYAGGGINLTVQKFNETTLEFVGNTISYGGVIFSVTTNNGFIYAGGGTVNLVRKYEDKGLDRDNQTFYNITSIKE